MQYELNDLVAQIDQLPAPNPVALEVMRLCSEPNISISQLVTLISTDQSLTSQVLRIANSSYFNFPKTIGTLDRAVVILGLNLLRDVALSIAFHSFYKGFKNQELFDFDYLWHHSLLTAVVSKALALKYDSDNQHLYYFAGLMHDIGKLVESQVIEKDFFFLVDKSLQEKTPLVTLERQFLKFHHGDVGALLLEKWNLPDYLISMVKYHHSPEGFIGETDLYRKIRFIYLSNLLVHYLQEEFTGYDHFLEVNPRFTQYYSFNYEEFETLIGYLQDYVEQQRGLFEIHQA